MHTRRCRDVARYVGAHLALGGYAEVEVAPCMGQEEEVDSMSLKALKAELAARGVAMPDGAVERQDLEALLRSSVCRARVVRHDEGRRRGAKAVVLARVDCAWHERSVDATAAVERAVLVLVFAEADQAAACGAWLSAEVAKRKDGTSRNECFPVVFFSAPGAAAHAMFEAKFAAESRPKMQRSDADRDLSGRVVCVAGACGLLASTRADGAVAALSAHGKLVLERLDSEREVALAKFYDLLSTVEAVRLDYLTRSHLTTVTWGALLVAAPLLAAAALDDTGTYREGLKASRHRRLVAAAAIREARGALAVSATRARSTAKDGRRAPLWQPSIDVAQGLEMPRLLEWALALPNPLFEVAARYVLGAPFGVETPPAADFVAKLKAAACSRPSPCLDALDTALREQRVRGTHQLPARIGLRADEPFLASLAALFVLLLFLGFFLFLELLLPNRRAIRAFRAANDAEL